MFVSSGRAINGNGNGKEKLSNVTSNLGGGGGGHVKICEDGGTGGEVGGQFWGFFVCRHKSMDPKSCHPYI